MLSTVAKTQHARSLLLMHLNAAHLGGCLWTWLWHGISNHAVILSQRDTGLARDVSAFYRIDLRLSKLSILLVEGQSKRISIATVAER